MPGLIGFNSFCKKPAQSPLCLFLPPLSPRSLSTPSRPVMQVKLMHKLCSYCHIFQHIYMLWDVIIMICILWGFFINPPYLGYNSAEQETRVLCIFLVLGTFWNSNRARIFWHHNFSLGTNMRRICTWVGQRGPNETRWSGPLARMCHPCSFEPRGSNVVHLDFRLIGLT
jgi:hypothetical protein